MLNKKIFFVVAGILIVLMGAYAGAKINLQKTDVKLENVNDFLEEINIDTTKLRLFTKVSRAIDFNANELSLSGTLTVHDGSDNSANVNNAPYSFIRKDSSFYYRLDLMEMINADGYYIQADAGQKKILLMPGKRISPQRMLPQLEKFVANLKEERYKILEMPASEGFRKISLINTHHITCKEYSITFNSETLKPIEIFVRLSNFDDPLNTKMDKTITMKYFQTNNLNDDKWLSTERIVLKTDQGFKPAIEYNGYEIIDKSTN